MADIIKVSPQLLNSTAEEFSNEGSALGSLTTEMTNLVTGLASTWEGEAATTYITKFKGLEDDIQLMIRMVQEHSSDLQTIAQQYIDVDAQNAEDASSLSSDVIV